MRKQLLQPLLLIMFALLLAACGGGDKAVDTTGGADVGSTEVETTAAVEDDSPYTISGIVVDTDDRPLADVQVLFAPFAPHLEPVTTDADGNWSRDGVTGSSINAIANHSDYDFGESSVRAARGDDPLRIVGTPIGCPEMSPCQIAGADDLQNIREHLDGYYVLVNDVDASETKDWNDGEGFEPIGGRWDRFVGVLDGDGFEIVGFYMNRPDEGYVALFRYVGPEGEIRNVGFVDGEVTGGRDTASIVSHNAGLVTDSYSTNTVTGSVEVVGGLIARNDEDGVLRNSYFAGSVHAHGSTAGGLAAENFRGRIEHSYNAGTVTSDGNYVGGITASNDGVIEYSYNTGRVEGAETVGGIAAGNNTDSAVRHSYNEGTVQGTGSRVGGIAGSSSGALIEYSSNRGDVTSTRHVGGIVGSNALGSIVAHSYNTGAVTATEENGGGIAGSNDRTVFDTFNEIRFVYNSGTIVGATAVGGIAGLHSSSATIEHAYSTGSVRVVEGHWGPPSAGGLVGQYESDHSAPDAGTIDAAFYNEDYFEGGPSDVTHTEEGTAASAAQLQDEALLAEAGWDFDEVWTMGDEYPELMGNPTQ